MPQSDFTAIFDLDGTLLDTLDDLTEACNYALRALGMPERARAEVRDAVGGGIRNAIKASLPAGTDDATIEAGTAAFRERYSQCYLDRTRPYAGVTEILRALRDRGIRIAVLSNKADAYTTGLVERHFNGLADAAAGERPGVPLKPAPDAVFAILRTVGGHPARAVYVGDSEVDAATARNAGIPCVLASWGFRRRDVLEAAALGGGVKIADDADSALALILAAEASDTLFISDLDGTLLNGGATFSAYTVRVLSELKRLGARFTVATARSPASALKVIAPVDVTAPVVMMNGALVYDVAAARYIKVEGIGREAALNVVGVMRAFGVYGFLYAINGDCDGDILPDSDAGETGAGDTATAGTGAGDTAAANAAATATAGKGAAGTATAGQGALRVYYENLDAPPLRKFYEDRRRLFNKVFTKIESYEDVVRSGRRIIYFTLRGGKAEMLPIYEAFKKVEGIGTVLCEDDYTPDLYFLECFGDGVSKRAAVGYLRETGGYRRVVGFGDNMNDLPLFEACDECYAPENAVGAAKAAATAVIGPNTDDGVARWLARRFGLTF